MRVLSLDHGSTRIGVAISDELRMIANPLEYIPAEPADAVFPRLRAILAEKPCDLIVVGMPRNMDGSYGPAAALVKEFVARLEPALGVRVRTWDERLTSAQANRMMIEGGVRRDKRKHTVDKMAAAILLQSFLDATSS